MNVSVIVVALNEQPHVRRAVQSAWHAGAAEVIVADGGSEDGTLQQVQGLCQPIVGEPGRAVQQNTGAAAATGDVLLFLHADNWLDPRAIDQIRLALANPAVVAGCFRQRIDDPGWVYRWIETGNAWRARYLVLPYGDQGLFVRRELFQRLGGFPVVAIMEDVMLARKLRRAGQIAVQPGPIHVSSRRWRRRGVVRQTIRNWMLLLAFFLGVHPNRLARFYPRHDGEKGG